jgi:hypothetical protein
LPFVHERSAENSIAEDDIEGFVAVGSGRSEVRGGEADAFKGAGWAKFLPEAAKGFLPLRVVGKKTVDGREYFEGIPAGAGNKEAVGSEPGLQQESGEAVGSFSGTARGVEASEDSPRFSAGCAESAGQKISLGRIAVGAGAVMAGDEEGEQEAEAKFAVSR